MANIGITAKIDNDNSFVQKEPDCRRYKPTRITRSTGPTVTIASKLSGLEIMNGRAATPGGYVENQSNLRPNSGNELTKLNLCPVFPKKIITKRAVVRLTNPAAATNNPIMQVLLNARLGGGNSETNRMPRATQQNMAAGG